MPTPTGYDWDTSWFDIDSASPIVLTQGGTITDFSEVITLDVEASCIISIDTTYSNHAKATGGLFIFIVREIGDGNYEVDADNPWGFEMVFTQNADNQKVFYLSGLQYNKFKIFQRWDNSTGSSVATTKTDLKKSTVPIAVA